MSRLVLLLFCLLGSTNAAALIGRDRRTISFFLQSGVNYGFPTGQKHYPVRISWGPNPILPVIEGGFDFGPALGYTFQTGVIASLSRTGRHGMRLGLGLANRGFRFVHFDYAQELDGNTYTQQTEGIRITWTELDLECAYLFTAGRMRVDIGLIGIIWRRQLYRERLLNGLEFRVDSPTFIRLRAWYPAMSIAYQVWRTDRVELDVFVALSRRGFANYSTDWWDGRGGIRVNFPSRRK